MADALNKYSTKSDYEAATHSSGYSEVSYIADRDISVYDGCNVETTRSPNVGDAVFLDASGKKRFIRGKGFDMAKVPNTWTKVGVVLLRKGNVVTIGYHSQIVGKYLNAWVYPFTPTSTTIVFSAVSAAIYDNKKATDQTFTASAAYDPNHPEIFCTELDTWLRANQPDENGVGGCKYSWHAEIIPWYDTSTKTVYEQMVILADSVLNYRQYSNGNLVKSGGTTNNNMFTQIPVDYYVLVANNSIEATVRSPVCNEARAKTYWYSRTSGDLKNKTDYDADATLTAKYATYEDYIHGYSLKWPSMAGKQHDYAPYEYDWNKQMRWQKMHNISGTEVPVFSSVNYANYPDGESGTVSGAFRWKLPNITSAFELFCNMPETFGGTINTTLQQLGGTNYQLTANKPFWLMGAGHMAEPFAYEGDGMFHYGHGPNQNCYTLPVADYEIGS